MLPRLPPEARLVRVVPALVVVVPVAPVVPAGVVTMVPVRLVEHLGILPIVALAGNPHQEETGGEAVESFHARHV